MLHDNCLLIAPLPIRQESSVQGLDPDVLAFKPTGHGVISQKGIDIGIFELSQIKKFLDKELQ